MNQLRLVRVVDFPAEPPDEDLEHIGERVVILVPHVRGDARAIDDLVAILDKNREERELLGSELDFLAVASNVMAAEIDAQVRNFHDLRLDAAPPTREGANAEQATREEGYETAR